MSQAGSPLPATSPSSRSLTDYKSLHGKNGPVADQLANFNDLDYHALNKFFAKSLNYNDVVTVAQGLGPFDVSFQCTDAKITAFIGVKNTNSYPITYHGNFLSGSDATVYLLNTGESANLKVAEWVDTSSTGTRVGTPASKGAVFTSNGYFLALSNADSYILTVSNDDQDDRMPNSDCTVAGFMEFAHPKGRQYYDGFLYEDVLLAQVEALTNERSSSGWQVFGGVFFGMIAGAAVIVVSTLFLTKNRSLLLHSVGYYDSCIAKSECATGGIDTSSTGLTSSGSEGVHGKA